MATYKSAYRSANFWLKTFDRAVASAAQSAVVLLTTEITGILELNLVSFFSIVGLSTAASIATSIAYPGRLDDEVRDTDFIDWK